MNTASITITSLYAGLLAILAVVLSIRVIRARRRHRVGLGDGDNAELRLAMRVQANCMEYVPLALLLLALAELGGAATWLLHTLGVMLMVGRLLHAFGFGRNPGVSKGRIVGMLMTFAVLLIGAGANIWGAINGLIPG